MRFPDKQRSPHEAGHGAHAGRLGASRDYTMEAALYLAAVAMEAAQAQLEAWARLTDEPHWAVVDAADLLDAARAALEGSR
ncbi:MULTISPECIES: hypothetical protein [Xanthomonas]|uniref:Uncharacterized protein n=4 Tax=Xanthomonas TaxID=338 RepID=A0A7U7HLW7_XANCJ|nr:MULTISPECIES: hypothetical protein [Xanthomonas]KAB7774603.1 hypothetical protein CEK65_18395 [Xanthomonas sp. LMG 12459]MBV6777679.1 hypothetical protein [Xanthomonas campestris pv. carissae]MCE4307610.1 hypothetical protein [Xanthomonas hortorum pv. vitians]MCE4371732.1 hypothetical protein [Xanthomonas hortorum pv. hederae]MCE4508228.1 hypothetical protein [Xanthomonas hortorum pv. vitians]